MTKHGERLAVLESEMRQVRKELEALGGLPALAARIAAWQDKLSAATAWVARRAALAALIVAAEYSSGVWGKFLNALARQLGQ